MPEARDLPLHRWGEEIRRHRVARREQRLRSAAAAVAAFTISALVASMLWTPRPLLVWNGSASARPGLYGVAAPADVRAGETVVAWTAEPARRLAAERRYLPVNVPLVKRVRAAKGDDVCAVGESILINGRHAALRRRADRRGRPMPWWAGCRHLGEGEYFLLMDHDDSFDGRYFGLTRENELVGRAVLLWAR